MAVSMFLRLDNINGEAQDATHTDEIDVLAWSWGMTRSGTMHTGGGGTAGIANFNDVSVTKWVDAASVPLVQYLTEGTHIATGNLYVRKSDGGETLEYVVLDMSDIIVTSVSTGGSGGEDRLTENVTLNFRTFNINYKKQGQDGGEATPFDFAWDIAAETAA